MAAGCSLHLRILRKESIVSTMGVLANVAGDDAEDTMIVGAAIKAWFPTAVAAFSFLLFNLLDSPCLAAISTMAHEMQSENGSGLQFSSRTFLLML